MEFKYDEVLDLWVAEAVFRGQTIEVRLYCRKDADFSSLATKAIVDMNSHWELLKTAVVSELLPEYNEESSQKVSSDEFFSRLVLKTIDFDARDIMYTLLWSDSGLFGGHSIQVFWDPEEEFHADVSLVG
ncbi:MAG: DUF2262 domain-containing protein [Planctomycetales bacterium]|nr:DUF2262 domain-containing protein [Planctomycetales bacterium]